MQEHHQHHRQWTRSRPQGYSSFAEPSIPEEPGSHSCSPMPGQSHEPAPRLHDSAGSFSKSKAASPFQAPRHLQPSQSWAPTPQRWNAAQTSPFALAPPHIGPGGQEHLQIIGQQLSLHADDAARGACLDAFNLAAAEHLLKLLGPLHALSTQTLPAHPLAFCHLV